MKCRKHYFIYQYFSPPPCQGQTWLVPRHCPALCPGERHHHQPSQTPSSFPALRVTTECHCGQHHHAVTAISKEGFTL